MPSLYTPRVDQHVEIVDGSAPTGGFTRVVIREDGRMVVEDTVDGTTKTTDLDVRGHSIYNPTRPYGNGNGLEFKSSTRRIVARKIGPNAHSFDVYWLVPNAETPPPATTQTHITFPQFITWPSGENQTEQTITDTHPHSMGYTLAALRINAMIVHYGLVALYEHLESIKGFYDTGDVLTAEQYIIYLHQGARAVCSKMETTDNRLDNISLKDRINFCQNTLLATSDITINVTDTQEQRLSSIAKQYFGLVEAARQSTMLTDIASPTHAVVVYDWRNNKHVKLTDVIAFSGAGNDSNQFTHEGGQVVNSLRLDSVKIQGDPDGTWVAGLTS